MRLLFETKDRPLYGSAVPMRLGPLADADLAAYVAAPLRGVAARGRRGPEPAARPRTGHPQRAMLLAHRLWARSSRAGRRRSTTGARPMRRRCASSSPSSTPSGAASTYRSRRRSGRSFSATARRTAQSRSARLELTKDVVRRAAPPPRGQGGHRGARDRRLRDRRPAVRRLDRRVSTIGRATPTRRLRRIRAGSPTSPEPGDQARRTAPAGSTSGRYGNHGTVISRLSFSTAFTTASATRGGWITNRPSKRLFRTPFCGKPSVSTNPGRTAWTSMPLPRSAPRESGRRRAARASRPRMRPPARRPWCPRSRRG